MISFQMEDLLGRYQRDTLDPLVMHRQVLLVLLHRYHLHYEDTGSYAVASPKAKSLIDAINPIIEESVAKAGSDGKTQYEKWVDEAQALFIALGDKAAEENPNEESGDLD